MEMIENIIDNDPTFQCGVHIGLMRLSIGSKVVQCELSTICSDTWEVNSHGLK